MKDPRVVYFKKVRIFLFIFIALTYVSGCSEKPKIQLATEYQAVFLDNNQAFFGKMENPSSEYVLLKDIFYIQQQVNQETKEVKNILIKRGSEWHGPDRMYINKGHIVIIEPVSPDSQVAKLIKEAEEKKP